MKIALLGGTGDIAEGLVLRWSKVGHEIFIGSRSDEKADAARAAEVVIISIPPEHAAPTISQIRDSFTNQVVVTPVVSMVKKGKVFMYSPPPHGSSALQIKEALPETTKLVSAYHNLPAAGLSQIDQVLDYDVVMCGDDDEAKAVVKRLTEEMQNLRVLDAGPIEASSMIEAITPLIVNLNIRYKPQHFSVKFV
jgi:NADPH-dependent F420 reductase